jgi:TP901 family phage tail tape measure protein
MNPIVVLIRANAKGLIDSVDGSKAKLKELSSFSSKLGMGLGLAGGGLGWALGLGNIPGMALQAEHSLQELGNIGNLLPSELKNINSGILKTSRDTNQEVGALIEGMKILVEKGMDPRVAQNFLNPIGKTATAAQANIDDLANTTYTFYRNLKVPVNELGKALDVAAYAGKAGSFELKDMAREMPGLTATASQLGIKGVAGVAKLSSALQIATLGASDPTQAAVNFSSFLQTITSQRTRGHFMQAGIDLKKVLNGALASGKDPIETILNTVQSRTKGDPFKIGFLFRDKESSLFIKAMTQNMSEYRRIRDESAQADGVNQRDFNRMMTTTIEQWKQLKIQLATTTLPHLAGPLSEVNTLLKTINSHTSLLKATLIGIAGLVGTGGGLLAFGTIAKSILDITKLVKVLREVSPAVKAARAAAAAAGPLAGDPFGAAGASAASGTGAATTATGIGVGGVAAGSVLVGTLLAGIFASIRQARALAVNPSDRRFAATFGGYAAGNGDLTSGFSANVPKPSPVDLPQRPTADISAARVIGAQNQGAGFAQGKKSAVDVNISLNGAPRGAKVDIKKRTGDVDLGVSHGLLFAQP